MQDKRSQVCSSDASGFSVLALSEINSTTAGATFTLGPLPFANQFLMFGLRMCPVPNRTQSGQGTCVGQLTLTNGGNHLSSDELLLPAIYRGLVWIWSAFLLLWVANWFVTLLAALFSSLLLSNVLGHAEYCSYTQVSLVPPVQPSSRHADSRPPVKAPGVGVGALKGRRST